MNRRILTVLSVFFLDACAMTPIVSSTDGLLSSGQETALSSDESSSSDPYSRWHSSRPSTTSEWEPPDVTVWAGLYENPRGNQVRPIPGNEFSWIRVDCRPDCTAFAEWQMQNEEQPGQLHLVFSACQPKTIENSEAEVHIEFCPTPEEGDSEPPFFIKDYTTTFFDSFWQDHHLLVFAKGNANDVDPSSPNVRRWIELDLVKAY